MTAIRYPVAPDAETALREPLGRAAREREALGVAGEAVAFVTERAGPDYATREAALDAHAGRLDDDRPGRLRQVAAEDRYCTLAEVMAHGRAPAPTRPTLQDGHRWPAPSPNPPKTVWRLMVSYWRPASAAPQDTSDQARRARRKVGEAMDAQALRNFTRQPLRPVKPQQPLDIGLFETRLPENPSIVVPDE